MLLPSDAEDDDPEPLEWPPAKKRKAEQAMLEAGGTICTKPKCNHVVAFDDPHKTCEMCRAGVQRRIESGAQAAHQRAYKKTPEGQSVRKRDHETQKANGNKAASARRQVENGNKAASNRRQVDNGNKAKSDKRRIESGAQAAHQRAYKKTPEGQSVRKRDHETQKANGNKAASARRQVENGNKAASNRRQVENGNKAKSDKRRVESGALAAAKREWKQTPEGQASVQRDRETQKANGNKAASDRRQVENGNKVKSNKKYKTSDKGKEVQKRSNKSIRTQLAKSLHKMVAGKHDFCEATTFRGYGLFATPEEAHRHFFGHPEFMPWMNASNQSRYVKGMGYQEVWQIGHRIAKSWYDHKDPDEVRRCWSRDNLFPQDGKQNVEKGKYYFPMREELMRLRHIWPKDWNDEVPDRIVAYLDPEPPEPPRCSPMIPDYDEMSDLDSDPSAGSD